MPLLVTRDIVGATDRPIEVRGVFKNQVSLDASNAMDGRKFRHAPIVRRVEVISDEEYVRIIKACRV